MSSIQPLLPEQLSRRFDPEQFQFATTAELEDRHEIIGQERALRSIQFGIGIQHSGYNLFALGPSGTGKYTALGRYLDQAALLQQTPDDWCYVYNFDQPHKPRALRFPPGKAVTLNQDMNKLVEELLMILPAAFTGDEYLEQRKILEEEYKSYQTQALEELREQAKTRNIAFIQTPGGFAFAPLKDGEVVSPDDFLGYSSDKQKEIESQVLQLQETLQKIMRQVPLWQREAQGKLKQLNRDVADFSIAPLIEELNHKYADLQEVVNYIDKVRSDVIENVDAFLDGEQPVTPATMGIASTQAQTVSVRYQVNVIVDHSYTDGAPVVFEEQPRYQNLVGRVEHVSQMGTLLTDFTLIKPGALHRANGGYLVLDARKVLLQPYAWAGLKNTLQNGNICIESLGQVYSYVSTVSLEPEPIPLKIKVILVGDRHIFYLLCQFDPEFTELFKVSADFEDDMERNLENCLAYALLIGALARKEGLRHFERTAVARIIEHSSRIAGDAQKLSVHMQSMSDLMREADYWAEKAEHDVVMVSDVQQALDFHVYRSSRLRDRIQERILRQSILIDTEGAEIGQINGLAVYDTGQYAFGKPSRITGRVRIGKGEVVDIERQVEMGGPIHSKGVLILTGFLGARYAAERPLSLSATLVFEQSYGGVEGDSASAAELYALLSALAQVPIQQSLAVTGSINQLGEVQAIGGVNEKIEGFFDLCDARGLTGDQGVVIPASNVQNLMLRQDVVEAVSEGKFNIFAVTTIDQGIEILTGLQAGEPDKYGDYPAGSINGLVVAKLDRLAEKQRAFAAPLSEQSGATGEGNREPKEK
jgi:lon-related putative ATP-dependent protease